MSRKVIQLKEEIKSIKDSSHKTYLNEPFKDTFDYKNFTSVTEKNFFLVVDIKSKESKREHYNCKKCDYKC